MLNAEFGMLKHCGLMIADCGLNRVYLLQSAFSNQHSALLCPSME
jgi:hypothetical protein